MHKDSEGTKFFIYNRQYYTRLNFLPEYPDLKPVNAVIRAESGIDENPDFKFVLTLIVNSINDCDNVEVKSQTLSKLIGVRISRLWAFVVDLTILNSAERSEFQN